MFWINVRFPGVPSEEKSVASRYYGRIDRDHLPGIAVDRCPLYICVSLAGPKASINEEPGTKELMLCWRFHPSQVGTPRTVEKTNSSR